MPTRNKIKWSVQDRKDLRNAINRYNAKIDRLISRGKDKKVLLPDKLSYKELKKVISLDSDYKKTLRSIKKFNEVGAELPRRINDSVTVTEWEYNKIKAGERKITKARAKEKMESGASAERGTLSKLSDVALMPKQFNPQSITERAWKKYVESVEKQKMDSYDIIKKEQYFANYLKAVDNQYGTRGRKIKRLVKLVGVQRMYELYYEDPNLGITFNYDPIEESIKIQYIEEALEAELNNR